MGITRKQEKRLREALAVILMNPKAHKQDVWTCGSKACLAGHLALMDGWKPVKATEKEYAKHADDDGYGGLDVCGWSIDGAVKLGVLVKKGKKVRAVHEVASELIGLDPSPDQPIFDAEKSVPELVELAERLIAGEYQQNDDYSDESDY